MLKFKLDSESHAKLDDGIKSLYQESDGAFYLQVEGAVSKEKVDEFRDNNIDLKNQLKTYEGIKPEEINEFKKLKLDGDGVKELQKTQRLLQEKKLFDQGEIDSIVDSRVNDRVATMKSDHESEVNTLKERISKSDSQLESLLIDNDIRKVATDMQVKPTAIDDVLLRAKQIYRLVDGQAIPHDAKGSVIYGPNGTDPMSPSDWMKQLTKTAPHLFEGAKGSGNFGNGYNGVGGDGAMSSRDKIAAALSQ